MVAKTGDNSGHDDGKDDKESDLDEDEDKTQFDDTSDVWLSFLRSVVYPFQLSFGHMFQYYVFRNKYQVSA
jgi:hypothetical protein